MNTPQVRVRSLDETRRLIDGAVREIKTSACSIADTLQSELLHNTKILKTVTTLLEDGLVLLDKDNRITVFNLAASAIFGIEAKDAVGKRLGQVFPHLSDRLCASTDGEDVTRLKALHSIGPNGEERYLRMAFTKIDSDNTSAFSPFGVLAVSRDGAMEPDGQLKERNQFLETELVRHENFLYSFPLPVFTTDATGCNVQGSRSFYDLIGFQPHMVRGGTIHDVLHRDYHDWFFSGFEKPRALRVKTSEGVQEFVAHKSQITDTQGQVVGYCVGLVQQQRTTIEDYGYVESFIKTIDASSNPLMLISFSEGRILLVNKAFSDKYGYSRTEIINSGVRALLTPGCNSPRLRRAFVTALSQGRDHQASVTVVDAGGLPRVVRVKSVAISHTEASGKLPKYCVLTEC